MKIKTQVNTAIIDKHTMLMEEMFDIPSGTMPDSSEFEACGIEFNGVKISTAMEGEEIATEIEISDELALRVLGFIRKHRSGFKMILSGIRDIVEGIAKITKLGELFKEEFKDVFDDVKKAA